MLKTNVFKRIICFLLVIGIVIPELRLYKSQAIDIFRITTPEYEAEIIKECLLEKYTPDPTVYSYVGMHVSYNN